MKMHRCLLRLSRKSLAEIYQVFWEYRYHFALSGKDLIRALPEMVIYNQNKKYYDVANNF